MKDLVRSVKVKVEFKFANGNSFVLPVSDGADKEYKTYGTSITLNEKLYSPDSTNIIGNICCSTLSIELVSRDKLLISTNENSEYYGFMNDTAIIEVSCVIKGEEEQENVFMGRYFVDSWENGASSSTYCNVSINCVDLLNRIKNVDLTKIGIKRNISFKDYLKDVLDKLNAQLSDDLKVKYNEDDLDIYKESGYDWNMYYNNINRDSIESIFNELAQNSLSYIWIDRDGYVKTDCLLDDTTEEPVSTLSGSTNLFSYNVQSGDIYAYSGVTVTYIDLLTYSDQEVLRLNNQTLFKGINNLSVNLNSDKVINVHHIEIFIQDELSDKAICNSFFVYKNMIDMHIYSEIGTEKATISVYGTIVSEITNTTTEYKDDSNRGSLLEINNTVLRKECIDTYRSGVVQLMKLENGLIDVEGYINPKIRVGDMVSVVGSSLNILGNYKVIGLDYSLGSSYRCTASLIRTTNILPSLDSMLWKDKQQVQFMISGTSISDYEFTELSEKNEEIVQSQIGNLLDDFESYME